MGTNSPWGVLMTEYQQAQYYNKDKFVNIHTCSKMSMEYFLSKLLFKGDLKRVLYSTLDYTFRKRLETVDTENGKDENTNINFVSLQLPYASYCQSSLWEPDDRMASVQASEMCVGYYDKITFSRLRAMAVKSTYKSTVFFGRDDDARVAYQLLSWEQNPKSPVMMYNLVTWHGAKLVIPTFFTIENIEYNPDFKQSDWLTKSRIIPINIEFTVRSYTVRIPHVDKAIQLPMKFGNQFGDSFDEDTDTNPTIVQEAILQFALEKGFGLDTTPSEQVPDTIGALTPKYFTPDKLSDDEKASLTRTVNEYTTDIIKGYFNEGTDVALNAFKINPARSTPTSLCLQFSIKPADFKFFDKMRILVPSRPEIIVTDCTQKEVMIPDLYPDSEYHLTILTYSTSGNIRTFKLTGKTPDSPDNMAPTIEKPSKVFNGSLVGLEW